MHGEVITMGIWWHSPCYWFSRDKDMKTKIVPIKRESLGAIKTLYVMVKGVLTPIGGATDAKVRAKPAG